MFDFHAVKSIQQFAIDVHLFMNCKHNLVIGLVSVCGLCQGINTRRCHCVDQFGQASVHTYIPETHTHYLHIYKLDTPAHILMLKMSRLKYPFCFSGTHLAEIVSSVFITKSI